MYCHVNSYSCSCKTIKKNPNDSQGDIYLLHSRISRYFHKLHTDSSYDINGDEPRRHLDKNRELSPICVASSEDCQMILCVDIP